MTKKNVNGYLLKNRMPYKLKIEDMEIEINYLNTEKTFNECMSNILEQKSKNNIINYKQ